MGTLRYPLYKDMKVFHELSVMKSNSASAILETNQLCFLVKGSEVLDQ